MVLLWLSPSFKTDRAAKQPFAMSQSAPIRVFAPLQTCGRTLEEAVNGRLKIQFSKDVFSKCLCDDALRAQGLPDGKYRDLKMCRMWALCDGQKASKDLRTR